MDIMTLLQDAVLNAMISVGIVQFAKNWIPETFPKKGYTFVFAGVVAAVSVVSSFCPAEVVNALLTLAVGQIGYENLIQVVQKVIGKLTEK